MPRFEVTGGNGRNASLERIADAIRQSGGKRISRRYAFGMSNQPKVVTFAADDLRHADQICKDACAILWPGDNSIMANLIAYSLE